MNPLRIADKGPFSFCFKHRNCLILVILFLFQKKLWFLFFSVESEPMSTSQKKENVLSSEAVKV